MVTYKVNYSGALKFGIHNLNLGCYSWGQRYDSILGSVAPRPSGHRIHRTLSREAAASTCAPASSQFLVDFDGHHSCLCRYNVSFVSSFHISLTWDVCIYIVMKISLVFLNHNFSITKLHSIIKSSPTLLQNRCMEPPPPQISMR